MITTKMITTTLIMGILSFPLYAKTVEVTDKNLVSFANFGAQALAVKNLDNDQVQVTIGGAILDDSDNEQIKYTNKNTKALAKLFKMKDVNAIVVTFASEDCQQNERISTLFQCISSENTPASIQAASLDYKGNLLALSEKVIKESFFSVSTSQRTTKFFNGDKFTDIVGKFSSSTLDIEAVKSMLGTIRKIK
jgi:hypothetical protein